MATVRVLPHGIGDLANDLADGARRVPRYGPKVVHRNVQYGHRLAQRFARGSAGPHGTNYYKRITEEMTGVLQGEYGPHGIVVENAVGAGWRRGPQNTDLARSADIVGPKLARDAGRLLDGLL